MPTLTRVVLAIVLDQVADWHAQGQRLGAAVNLSASSLVDADLPQQVASMLASRKVSPHALQLEITEEFLMGDQARGYFMSRPVPAVELDHRLASRRPVARLI